MGASARQPIHATLLSTHDLAMRLALCDLFVSISHLRRQRGTYPMPHAVRQLQRSFHGFAVLLLHPVFQLLSLSDRGLHALRNSVMKSVRPASTSLPPGSPCPGSTRAFQLRKRATLFSASLPEYPQSIAPWWQWPFRN